VEERDAAMPFASCVEKIERQRAATAASLPGAKDSGVQSALPAADAQRATAATEWAEQAAAQKEGVNEARPHAA
jgi:hypothetical protein